VQTLHDNNEIEGLEPQWSNPQIFPNKHENTHKMCSHTAENQKLGHMHFLIAFSTITQFLIIGAMN